jgi:hypothetical protein
MVGVCRMGTRDGHGSAAEMRMRWLGGDGVLAGWEDCGDERIAEDGKIACDGGGDDLAWTGMLEGG